MSEMHHTDVWKVQYPDQLKTAVAKAASTWQKFCELPADVQDLFTTDNMFNGNGFERKMGTGDVASRFSQDKKLNFDITAQGITHLIQRADKISDPKDAAVAQTFLTAVSELLQQSPSAMEEFGSILEQQYDVEGFQNLATSSAPNAFFRFLYYPPTETVGEVIGEPHVDNSGFTLHLYESTEGCEALSSDRKTWFPMPVSPNNALAFPSMQTQLFSEGKIDGLCHRILSNETTQHMGRYAIVCFIPLNGMPAYDREKHGRLQEKEPGFNYGMNPEEFKNYFLAA